MRAEVLGMHLAHESCNEVGRSSNQISTIPAIAVSESRVTSSMDSPTPEKEASLGKLLYDGREGGRRWN